MYIEFIKYTLLIYILGVVLLWSVWGLTGFLRKDVRAGYYVRDEWHEELRFILTWPVSISCLVAVAAIAAIVGPILLYLDAKSNEDALTNAYK
jgi:hypothetical protein